MNNKTTPQESKSEIDLLEDLYEFIVPKFREAHDIMVSMLDFPRDEPVKIAELGCGFGELAERIFDFFPAAQVMGIDNQPEILDRAGNRFQESGEQFTGLHRDLNENTWGYDLAPLHAVMSSFTLDYLTLERHEQLIQEAVELLATDGRWVSCEFFSTDDNRINRVFHDIEINIVQSAMQKGLVSTEQIEQLTQSAVLRQNHYVCDIEDKIEWLKKAGFVNIQMPWRFLNIAILTAQRK